MERTVIAGVNLIDPVTEKVVPSMDITVEGTAITALAPSAGTVPDGALDGRGRFAIPGLIDSHVHIAFNGFLTAKPDFRRTLKQYLVNGVTSVVDFFTAGGNFPGSSAETVRDDINAGRFLGPHVLSSYGCLNAPGGFCSCSVGDAAFEVVTMDDVHKHLDHIEAVRPDFVKIVYDDVFGTLPNLTPDLLRYLIEQVHERGFRAAVHIATVDDAIDAVDCGADILGHGITGTLPEALLTKMRERGIIVIPTLASYEARSLRRKDISLPAYSPPDSVEAYLNARQSIYEVKDQIDLYREAHEQAAATVRPMLDAGVPVVAGSDCGTWYTFPGDALHRELEIYCGLGVEPAQALRMATIEAARAFGLDDRRGTIEPGKVADLVVLEANPLEDISAVRRTSAVVLRGEVLDLDDLRAQITGSAPVAEANTDDLPCSPHHLFSAGAASE